VYFQVYHPRVPIVNPTRFRNQFREALHRSTSQSLPDSPSPPKRTRFSEDSGSLSTSPANGAAGTSATGSGEAKPLHRALLACLIAWGSKFSDHALLVMDRQQSQNRSRSQSHSQAQSQSTDLQESSLSPPTIPSSRLNGSSASHLGGPLLSNISRLLVDRAREIAELDKVFRVATPDNVVVCLLSEPLQHLPSCK
jgi:hypothetical protein